MSWLDQFFDAIGVAPIVTTFGPAPSISITPATDSAAGSMSAADKAKLDAFLGSSGAVTVSTLTLSGQPDPFLAGPYTHTTTDATPYTLLSLAVPVASTLDAEIRCIANLGAGPNKNPLPSIYRLFAVGVRTGSGAVVGDVQNDFSTVARPFVSTQNSATPGPGSFNVWQSGNNVLLQIVGFAIKEAWTSGHTYTNGNGSSTPGDFVTSAGGIYLCTTGGVAGATPPTGTGTGISDGTDEWSYMGPASGFQVPVDWTLVVSGLVGG